MLTIDQLVDRYAELAILVRPTVVPRIAPDPDDDVVIGTALAAKADRIVTGDRPLLSVRVYEGVRIIFGPTPENYGSIAELSFDGTRDITLASGEIRRWVVDGDDIILRAHGRREGYAAIGFGDCCARMVAGGK